MIQLFCEHYINRRIKSASAMPVCFLFRHRNIFKRNRNHVRISVRRHIPGVHNLFQGLGHKQIWNQSGGPQRGSEGSMPQWGPGEKSLVRGSGG